MNERTAEGATYTGILYGDYAYWMEKHHIQPLPLGEFGTALRLLNIDRQRDRRGSLVALALRPSPARLQAQQQARRQQAAKLRKLFR